MDDVTTNEATTPEATGIPPLPLRLIERVREWWNETIRLTHGGVVMIVAGYLVLAVGMTFALAQVDRYAARQVADTRAVVQSVAAETRIRALENCLTRIEGRQALRDVLIDTYTTVAGTTTNLATAEALHLLRDRLDDRYPPLDPTECDSASSGVVITEPGD